MSPKQICFRFDIDTHKCLGVGVPNLLNLAREHKVRFSFLIHGGRSIEFFHSLLDIFKRTKGPRAATLSPRRKLGTKDFLRCALLNPPILKSYPDIVKRAAQEGHEVGLHGGRNHATWARLVNQWTDEELHDEINWGCQQLKALGIEPRVFGSPCAAGGEKVRLALANFPQFEFISDQLKNGMFRPLSVERGPRDIPVSITGEGGVAFVEHQVALHNSIEEAGENFRTHLRRFPLQIVYDHPFFAGDEGLSYTACLVQIAKDEGFEFVSLQTLGRSLVANA